MSRLKVGVIGVGGIAKTHMPGWEESLEAEVIASSDIDAGVLNEWGNNYQIKKLLSYFRNKNQSNRKYPKRVFEVILKETHNKEESDYFYFTDPSFFN